MQINFLIATPIFTFLSLAYLEITPRFVQKSKFHLLQFITEDTVLTTSSVSVPFVHIALEAINAILYFAGFIALGVFLGNLLLCKGKVCASARGATIFAAFSFVLWSATTGLVLLEIFKGGLSGVSTDKAAKKAMEEQKKRGNDTEMNATPPATATVV